MNAHHIIVKQLCSESYSNAGSPAFFNVEDNEYGSISVMATVYSKPTYLVGQFNDPTIRLIQFTNKLQAKDWFTRHQHYVGWIKHIIYNRRYEKVGWETVELQSMLIDKDDLMYPEHILGEERRTPVDDLTDVAQELYERGHSTDVDTAKKLFDIISDLGGHRFIR